MAARAVSRPGSSPHTPHGIKGVAVHTPKALFASQTVYTSTNSSPTPDVPQPTLSFTTIRNHPRPPSVSSSRPSSRNRQLVTVDARQKLTQDAHAKKLQQDSTYHLQAAEHWMHESKNLRGIVQQLRDVELENGQLRLELDVLRRNTNSFRDSEFHSVSLEVERLSSNTYAMSSENETLRLEITGAREKSERLELALFDVESRLDTETTDLSTLQVEHRALADAHKITLQDNNILLTDNKRLRDSKSVLQADLAVFKSQTGNILTYFTWLNLLTCFPYSAYLLTYFTVLTYLSTLLNKLLLFFDFTFRYCTCTTR